MTEAKKKVGRPKNGEHAFWRAYVRIPDVQIYEKLKLLEEKKNIKIGQPITNSLYYGLEPYIKAELGEIEAEEYVKDIPTKKPQAPVVVESIPDKVIEEMVALLEEIVLNVTLTKSMTSSLFNEKAKNLYGYSVRPELFERGDLRDTPQYLLGHEKMVMKKIQESRRKNE